MIPVGFDPEEPIALLGDTGRELSIFMSMLKEFGAVPNDSMERLKNLPRSNEEAMSTFLGKPNSRGAGGPVAPMGPMSPTTAPQQPQTQETPQGPLTSETAPEPSEGRTEDPIGTMDRETVKEAPAEVFSKSPIIGS